MLEYVNIVPQAGGSDQLMVLMKQRFPRNVGKTYNWKELEVQKLEWRCGIAGKATICSADIAYGQQLESWLLHF